jgi:opacity protein-like surface antigen
MLLIEVIFPVQHLVCLRCYAGRPATVFQRVGHGNSCLALRAQRHVGLRCRHLSTAAEAPLVEQPIEVVETSGWHLRGDVGYAWNDLRGAHYFQGSNSSLVDFDRADLDDSYVLGGGIGYQITNRRVRSCSSLTSSRKESLIDVGGFPFQLREPRLFPAVSVSLKESGAGWLALAASFLGTFLGQGSCTAGAGLVVRNTCRLLHLGSANARTRKNRGSRDAPDERPGLASRRAIGKSVGSLLFGAMRTAVNDVTLLDSMPDDPDAAMRACRSEFLDRAFETIEGVGFISQIHLESLVIVVAALVAFGHGCIPPVPSDQPRE